MSLMFLFSEKMSEMHVIQSWTYDGNTIQYNCKQGGEKLTTTVGKEIGKIVKNAREKESLTQQELSEKIGMSRNYISDIECGRYVPSLETTILLADALNIDLNLLKSDGNTRRE